MFSVNQIISQEQIDETASFFACWNKFTKIKSSSTIFCFGMVENECGQSGHGTLKLAVSQEWTGGINWYLHSSTNSCKIKGDWKFLGWSYSKMGVASLVTGLKNWL